MAVTTRIKLAINRLLSPAGLQLSTLTEERSQARRLAALEERGYFGKSAFPVPDCLRDSPWQAVIEALDRYRSDLDRLNSSPEAGEGFDCANPFFHPPDSDVLYALVRDRKPRRVIEIGSGNSTRLSRRAIRDGGLDTRLISIDPAPRAEVAGIADEVRRHRVEDLPAEELAAELEPGDFLFIDSSHLVAVGNDCVYEFLDLIPRLAPGVVIHVHDVSLPWDYPIEWVRAEPQVGTWGEIYLLQSMLWFGADWTVLWPGYYVQQNVERERFDEWFPDRRGRDARSFWLVRGGTAEPPAGA